MRWVEFITDPSSQQLSASRFLLMFLILIYLPVITVLDLLGYKLAVWLHLAVIVSAVAGAYGANSAARAWKAGGTRGPKED